MVGADSTTHHYEGKTLRGGAHSLDTSTKSRFTRISTITCLAIPPLAPLTAPNGTLPNIGRYVASESNLRDPKCHQRPENDHGLDPRVTKCGSAGSMLNEPGTHTFYFWEVYVMKQVATLTICATVGFCLAVGPASAMPLFRKDFTEKYVEGSGDAVWEETVKKASCYVCHVKGEDKEVRNAYGEELAKLIKGDAKDRVTAAKEADNLAAENEKLSKELMEAFKKVEKMKSPSGPTYGELLKAHKLPE
jgi:hypothetical protein